MKNSKKSVGKVLEQDFMEPLRLSQSELARAINVPRARISNIIANKQNITPDTDLRLCRYFELEDGFFLRLQSDLELLAARDMLAQELESIAPCDDPFRQRLRHASQPGVAKEKLHVALICGGPSPERGISLNSARSIMDHLNGAEIELHPFYVDYNKNFYEISTAQLYSNTPSDFDFKLAHTAKKLTTKALVAKLKSLDIIFPVIHGQFGEDGELQAFLEKHEIPFVGSDAVACQRMFNKRVAAAELSKLGYPTIPAEILHQEESDNPERIARFFTKYKLERAIIKPVAGGSSIGVFSVTTAAEAAEKLKILSAMDVGNEAIIEPFCVGKEFTIIVLQNVDGTPVALIPSEIQVNYENGGIFDYRRKYLPTSNTKWPCPPHFSDKVVESIQQQAEQLFTEMGMRDFARLDGWVMSNGEIIFADLNPISGMEQNSFIFQQASRLGMTHQDVLENLIYTACLRHNITVPAQKASNESDKKKVYVLFGGNTAERQVSLMSGTNIWLKLRQSSEYAAEPFFLDQKGHVWHLPYTYTLNHTVEEVYDNCLTSSSSVARLERFSKKVSEKLSYAPIDYNFRENTPEKYTFSQFLDLAKDNDAFVFIGLHGGDGENGVIQQRLDEEGINYNGSGPQASELCMDKYLTGETIAMLGDEKLISAPKKTLPLARLINANDTDYETFWESLQRDFGAETFIIKPQKDGCSAGIVHLYEAAELKKYVQLIIMGADYIPENTFKNQSIVIEMAQEEKVDYFIEPFIETDYIRIVKNELDYKKKNGWLELTVGVLESNGSYHALSPSITIAEGEVLSLEEKFQGGTGVNITPPPEGIISLKQGNKIKASIERAAKALGIENYARLDVFFNVKTDEVMLIEANTLPGLTGSTVIFHQALAESPALPPRQFLEKIIELKA